jgi:hypothetical protein
LPLSRPHRAWCPATFSGCPARLAAGRYTRAL